MKVTIVKGPLLDDKPGRAKYRVARADGREVRVRVVDADSESFGADFTAAFRANVRRVRKENAAVKAGA